VRKQAHAPLLNRWEEPAQILRETQMAFRTPTGERAGVYDPCDHLGNSGPHGSAV
jgi:hypothetical protein